MIKNVSIIPGCIACRNCEKICPLVFKVQGQSKVISQETAGIEDKVLEAARMCPVQVIKVDHDGQEAAKASAQLVSKTMLNEHILELRFATQDFTYTPGQYISLFMDDKKGSFSRAYSIADADATGFTLTVKLTASGRGSSFLRNLSLQDKREASYLGPHGFFKLASTTKKQLYIGTGTGLAPLYAMIQSSPHNPKKLLV
ncbi:MAG: ferredoxin [Candidatus Peribacteria bacterium]|nr:MAG: ferredoxin [Candidatus Peribacteria bacterium]